MLIRYKVIDRKDFCAGLLKWQTLAFAWALTMHLLDGQQVLSNSKLDAVRNELHALNEKAAIAARVTPPEKNGSP
jgi:hypothetical protein